MIFYSIMPYDVVFQNTAQQDQNVTRTVAYNGCTLEVIQLGNGQAQINRIISTSLKDYLNPKLQPGTVIDIV